jgi:hypothetical protein
LDTGYRFHSYYNIKELKRSGRLCKGEMDLHVGHGARVIALVVETYYWTFLSKLILEIDNY